MTAKTTTPTDTEVLTAQVGDQPGNKREQAKFAKMTPEQQAAAREIAARLVESTTVAKAWTEALATAVAEPEPEPTPAAPKLTRVSGAGGAKGAVSLTEGLKGWLQVSAAAEGMTLSALLNRIVVEWADTHGFASHDDADQ